VLISFLLLVDMQTLQTNWSVKLVWISSSQHLPPEGEITPLTEGTMSLNHQPNGFSKISFSHCSPDLVSNTREVFCSLKVLSAGFLIRSSPLWTYNGL